MKSRLTRNPSNGSSPRSAKPRNRIVLHVDMDSFFASVEQRCNPKLRGKPIFVCGEGRTVVTTASYEARKYGVKTGMTKYEALRKCPFAVPVSGDHVKYADVSARIWEILKNVSDRAEMFSIDEAFLDITDAAKSFDRAFEIAGDIKGRIKNELGLTCSIGVAPNKLLAKLGSDMNKPDGFVVIKEEDVPRLLKDLPVDKFCGIGEKTARRLAVLGIKTAGQLGGADEGLLCNYFGFMGHFLKKMGMGIDNSEVAYSCDSEPAKSFGHSYTMQKDTAEDRTLRAFLLWLSEKVGRRMRQAGFRGRIIHFFMRYCDFTGVSKQTALKSYADRGYDIYKAALRIMNSYKPLPKPVRLLGVSVSGLVYKDGQQYLFEEDKKISQCQETVDKIKDIYGEDSIIPMALLERDA